MYEDTIPYKSTPKYLGRGHLSRKGAFSAKFGVTPGFSACREAASVQPLCKHPFNTRATPPGNPLFPARRCLWIAIATFWIHPGVQQSRSRGRAAARGRVSSRAGSPGQEPGGLSHRTGQLSHSPTCHLQRALRCCDLLSPTILGKHCKPQLSKGEITGPPKRSAAGYRPNSSVWLIPQLIYLPRQGAAVCAILLLLRALPAQLVSLPSLQELPVEVTERSRKMKLALLHARQKG